MLVDKIIDDIFTELGGKVRVGSRSVNFKRLSFASSKVEIHSALRRGVTDITKDGASVNDEVEVMEVDGQNNANKVDYNWADTGGRSVATYVARLEGASASSRRFSYSSVTSKQSTGRENESRQGGGGKGRNSQQQLKRTSANFVLPEPDDRRIKSRLVNKSFEKREEEERGKKKKKKISTDKIQRFMESKLGKALAEYLSDSDETEVVEEEGNE